MSGIPSLPLKWEERPWGRFYVAVATHDSWSKVIAVNPQSRLSLQIHEHRSEIWYPVTSGLSGQIGEYVEPMHPGKAYVVLPGVAHRIINNTDRTVCLLEIAVGKPDEKDIVRLEDDYGRHD